MSYVTTSSRQMLPPRRMPHRPRARERAAGTSANQGRPAEGAVLDAAPGNRTGRRRGPGECVVAMTDSGAWRELGAR
ncbi:hypothetical protein M2157_002064 [Streptomyces sp. SAI-127]|nr:hypothetical protein [Streptomyces sp. SAI-127]